MDGKTCAVHDDMEWFLWVYPCIQERFQCLASAGESGVVRCGQIESHQCYNGADEAFSLAEREVKEKAQCEDGLDGDLGIHSLSTWFAIGFRDPCLDSLFRDPQSDIAPVPERTVVLAPVPVLVLVALLILWISISLVGF